MNSSAIPTVVDSSKHKILLSAEQLFSESGFNGVSVRDIAQSAGVNSALVGYYFGSKQGLLEAVYLRHCKPLNQERLRLLQEASNGGRVPTVEEILEAFLRPALVVTKNTDGTSVFTRLRTVLSGENSTLLEPVIAEHFDRPTRTFIDALKKALPNLTREDILWRFHFLLGSLYHTGAHASRLLSISGGQCDPSDTERCLKYLIPFLAAGFSSPHVYIPDPVEDALSGAAV